MAEKLNTLTKQELKMLQAFTRDRLRNINKEREELQCRMIEIETLLNNEELSE